MRRFSQISFLILISYQIAICQTYRVLLGNPTWLDIPDVVLITTQDSLANSILPDNVSKENSKFLKIYTGGLNSVNYEMYILVVHHQNYKELYLDRNYDLNFKNDEKPLIFGHEKGSIVLTIFNNSDNKRFIQMSIDRRPRVNDNFYLDSAGNMNSKSIKIFSIMNKLTNFTGKKGTFYFDNDYILRRGILDLGNIKYDIGLSDFNRNGLYNDKKYDLFTVDLNKDQQLSALDQTETFSLKDVFKIDNKNYEIRDIDPYGNWVKLEETKNKATFFFINEQVEKSSSKYKIDTKVWGLTVKTIDGEKIALNKFKGKYVLLNFWGEWCGACMPEIPLLVDVNDKSSNTNIRIVSFIKISNYEKAKKMILEKGIKYPQIPLSKELEKQFKISSYPTNILILPNGNEGIITQGINDSFLNKYIK